MSFHILITGANGFLGRNFVESLKAVKAGKDKVHGWGAPGAPDELEIFEYDLENTEKQLEEYCEKADFVFHFAGVNRPENNSGFMEGNYGFTSKLLDMLKRLGNSCPVMLSSSVQATLKGRYEGSEYGASKLAGENLLKEYAKETGANVLIYRFPNIFGKWCRPNYNSVIATFCNNIANGLPIQVNDRGTKLELVYIDDVIDEMFLALNGKEHRNSAGDCYVPATVHVALGEIADMLYEFKDSRNSLKIPDMAAGSFSKKLYATYLSYLPADRLSYPLKMNVDGRGSFTEILKTVDRGQVSVNISRPGITRGQHWHHTKNEKFIVVSGKGLIQLRKIGLDPETGTEYPICNYYVCGEEITAVDMIPGYTHNIINLSETENLVTLIWCNECFDPGRPDTFFEEV